MVLKNKKIIWLAVVSLIMEIILTPALLITQSSIAYAADYDEIPPLITLSPISVTANGKRVTVKAVIDDENNVKTHDLYYRNSEDSTYKKSQMIKTKDNIYQADIPASEVIGKGITYYIIAVDEYDNENAEGTAESPHFVESGYLYGLGVKQNVVVKRKDEILIKEPQETVQSRDKFSEMMNNPDVSLESFGMPPKKTKPMQAKITRKPWYKKWWVWSIVIAAAAGAAASQSTDSGSAEANSGIIIIN